MKPDGSTNGMDLFNSVSKASAYDVGHFAGYNSAQFATTYALSEGSGLLLGSIRSGPSLSMRILSREEMANIWGAGIDLSKFENFGMCREFASAFKKAYGGVIKEINLQKEGFDLIGGPNGIQLSNNGLHHFVEKVIDGKEYIFDNLHSKGILKSEYTKGLDAVNMRKGQIIYGEALMKNAKIIK
jgi:hypothetical protein